MRLFFIVFTMLFALNSHATSVNEQKQLAEQSKQAQTHVQPVKDCLRIIKQDNTVRGVLSLTSRVLHLFWQQALDWFHCFVHNET